MKRIFSLLLAAALLLTGCGKQPAATEPESTAEPEKPLVSMYDLRKSMEAVEPGLPEMLSASSSDTDAETLFAYLSDLDYEKVDGYFLSYAADGQAWELAVAAVKDPAELPALEASLLAHLRDRIKLYENYAPEQVAQATAAEIVTEGRYAALIMCEDRDAVKEAFLKGVR